MTLPTGRPVAVVAGVAHGAGFRLATTFAQQGFDLVLTANDPHVNAAAQACAAWGARVVPVRADLGTADGVEAVYAAIGATARAVEVLVLNAGIDPGSGVPGTSHLDETTLITRNVELVRLAKLVVGNMVAHGHGRIVLTSASAPRQPDVIGAASMAFVQTFATSLCTRLAPMGVTVTVLPVGATDAVTMHGLGISDSTACCSTHDERAEHGTLPLCDAWCGVRWCQ